MSPYEEALSITARVTAGLFLVGCGGSVAVPEPPPEPSTTAPPRATASSPPAEPSAKPLGVDCNALLDAIEADWSQYSKTDPKVLAECCAIDGNKTRPACTPWGPPMPPAMVLS